MKNQTSVCWTQSKADRHKIQLSCEARHQNYPSFCLHLPASCSHLRAHQRQRPPPTETARATTQLSLLRGTELRASSLGAVSQLQTADTQREMDRNTAKYDNQSLVFTVPGCQPNSAHDFCPFPGYTPTQSCLTDERSEPRNRKLLAQEHTA